MHFAKTEAHLLVRAQNLFACWRSRPAFRCRAVVSRRCVAPLCRAVVSRRCVAPLCRAVVSANLSQIAAKPGENYGLRGDRLPISVRGAVMFAKPTGTGDVPKNIP